MVWAAIIEYVHADQPIAPTHLPTRQELRGAGSSLYMFTLASFARIYNFTLTLSYLS